VWTLHVALGPHSGLVEKTAKEVPSTLNARAETVAQKPMFRSAFKRTRGMVPASGYYEWRAVDGGKHASGPIWHAHG
jgi:putative SOS response-associated peptidase YedK